MIAARRSRAVARHRAGVVLALFAVLLFGFLALLALVVDLGLVMLTRRQMQGAANAAALEGARYLNVAGTSARTKAAEMVELYFDDDLNSSLTATDPVRFGAGPNIEFSGGLPVDAGAFRAGARLSFATSRLYRPTTKTNGDDADENLDLAGDIVYGTAITTSDHSEAGVSAPFPYLRADFTMTNRAEADAVLVRLRRTGEALTVTDTRSATIGPRVPSLFRRGNPLGAGPTAQAFRDEIEAGYPVRTTAIASYGRAMSVGTTTEGLPAGTPACAPIALQITGFSALSTTSDIALSSDGSVTPTGHAISLTNGAISIGDPLAVLETASATLVTGSRYYIPFYEAVDAAGIEEDVVVGFRQARVDELAPLSYRLTWEPEAVGWLNASIRPARAWKDSAAPASTRFLLDYLQQVGAPASSEAEYRRFITEVVRRSADFEQPLRAPALVRAVR